MAKWLALSVAMSGMSTAPTVPVSAKPSPSKTRYVDRPAYVQPVPSNVTTCPAGPLDGVTTRQPVWEGGWQALCGEEALGVAVLVGESVELRTEAVVTDELQPDRSRKAKVVRR